MDDNQYSSRPRSGQYCQAQRSPRPRRQAFQPQKTRGTPSTSGQSGPLGASTSSARALNATLPVGTLVHRQNLSSPPRPVITVTRSGRPVIPTLRGLNRLYPSLSDEHSQLKCLSTFTPMPLELSNLLSQNSESSTHQASSKTYSRRSRRERRTIADFAKWTTVSTASIDLVRKATNAECTKTLRLQQTDRPRPTILHNNYNNCTFTDNSFKAQQTDQHLYVLAPCQIIFFTLFLSSPTLLLSTVSSCLINLLMNV